MASSAFHGPLRRNPVNPRYFTDDTGKSIYLTGSHTWAVMADMWIEGEKPIITDYPGFLTMLADHGHNFFRFWQWPQLKCAVWNDKPTVFTPHPYQRTGPGLANDGLPKFDLTKWNDDYFRRLRQRVEMAAEYGIYTSIMLFEAWGIKTATDPTDPWPYYPQHPANNVNGITDNPVLPNGRAWNYFSLHCPQLLEQQKSWIRKVIETVNDLDHVLFEVCNEVPLMPDAFVWMDHIANYVHEVERSMPKQHPVGITGEGGDQDIAYLMACPADWISPGNGDVMEYRYNPPAADGAKVMVVDTDHMWGHGCDVAWVWKSFTRGMNVLFMDPWIRIPGEMGYYQDGSVSTNQRYYYKYDDMRRTMGYARKFALQMNLNRCVPHNELCTSGYCLADPGREYLCYMPVPGAPEGFTLRGYPGQYSVLWFDTVTGKSQQGANTTGDKRFSLYTPFSNSPTVAYIRKID